jgi:hypothetical protein
MWLTECKDKGMSTELLRPDRGNRGYYSKCVNRERTVTEDAAFSIGSRIGRDPSFKMHADGMIALYAAGYLSTAAECLQGIIARALAEYPHRSAVLKHGIVADIRYPAVRELKYGLTAAVGIPYALANIDGIPDESISPSSRAEFLARVTSQSESSYYREVWKDHLALRATRLEERVRRRAREGDQLPIADREVQAWTSFVNGLSLLARRDAVLQLHFSMMRALVDEYQRIRYAVPHHT